MPTRASSVGAAVGSIMAIIMTTHMRKVRARSAVLHAPWCIPAMAPTWLSMSWPASATV